LQPQSTVTGWFAKPSRIAVKCCATVTSTSSLRPRLLRGGVMAHLHAAAGRQRVQTHAGQQGCKNQSLHRFLRGQNSLVKPEDRMNIAK
jgi:hypothetical protein